MNNHTNDPTDKTTTVNSGDNDAINTTALPEVQQITDNLKTTDNRGSEKKTRHAVTQILPPQAQKTIENMPPLTPKQKAFVQYLLDNPKGTKTEAYMSAYSVKTTNTNTIHPEASRTASLPQVKHALELNSDVFESVIVNTAKQWGNSDKTRERELALQASYYGHDKIHGKAKQQIEQTITGVTLTIDLTSSLEENEQ